MGAVAAAAAAEACDPSFGSRMAFSERVRRPTGRRLVESPRTFTFTAAIIDMRHRSSHCLARPIVRVHRRSRLRDKARIFSIRDVGTCAVGPL